jgi:hypothetical protein
LEAPIHISRFYFLFVLSKRIKQNLLNYFAARLLRQHPTSPHRQPLPDKALLTSMPSHTLLGHSPTPCLLDCPASPWPLASPSGSDCAQRTTRAWPPNNLPDHSFHRPIRGYNLLYIGPIGQLRFLIGKSSPHPLFFRKTCAPSTPFMAPCFPRL